MKTHNEAPQLCASHAQINQVTWVPLSQGSNKCASTWKCSHSHFAVNEVIGSALLTKSEEISSYHTSNFQLYDLWFKVLTLDFELGRKKFVLWCLIILEGTFTWNQHVSGNACRGCGRGQAVGGGAKAKIRSFAGDFRPHLLRLLLSSFCVPDGLSRKIHQLLDKEPQHTGESQHERDSQDNIVQFRLRDFRCHLRDKPKVQERPDKALWKCEELVVLDTQVRWNTTYHHTQTSKHVYSYKRCKSQTYWVTCHVHIMYI